MENEKEILLEELEAAAEPASASGGHTAAKPSIFKNKKMLIALCSIAGVLAAVLLAAVILFFSVMGEINGSGRRGGGVFTVTVPQGASASAIAELLEDSGAIGNSTVFRLYCKLENRGSDFNYGSFQIVGGTSYEDIAETLSGQVVFAETKKVTIPEGTGVYDYVKTVNGKDVTVPGISTLLVNAGVCTEDDFFAALNEVSLDTKLLKNVNKTEAYCLLEGYLYPDTYDFYFYTAESYDYSSMDCARLAVGKMLSKAEQVFTDELYARADELGYSVNEILTLASIVQLEAGIDEDAMADVAAVFYNRLKNPASFPTLGSSATVYYGSFNPNDDDRYCTQHIYNGKGEIVKNATEGLPPGPICSPGMAAIKAALYPTENFPKTYFVTDSKGKFFFTASQSEHQQVIKALQNGDNWIYETLK